MFIRKKKNKSGVISVQVIDKSSGRYKVLKTIGSSSHLQEIEKLYQQAQDFIKSRKGLHELDFSGYTSFYQQVLDSITSHKLVGINLVLGKIFDQIGFNQIPTPLFKELVLYRLVYPKSKLKTTEYLARFEQKYYSEDDIYRYMDKLYATQLEKIQEISYQHTQKLFSKGIQVVFYDVTTIYFEIDREDDFRKTGFSKEGKHHNPQILLGLLVSKGGYPLAYDVFEGNKFEGHTILPVIDSFKQKYQLKHLVVVADSGLISSQNIDQLREKGYEFIIGARIKNLKKELRDKITSLTLRNGESILIPLEDLKLIITYSDDRANKDRYNREKGIKRIEKQLGRGKLTKSSINNRGYNKFLTLEGDVSVTINQEKIEQDKKWDGLKGYITNSCLDTQELLDNYKQLWRIEKAFRVAKSELRIRPVFHYKRRRIEAHICLNFVAYKVYKELERLLKEWDSELSAERVIDIIQNIYKISVRAPDNSLIEKIISLDNEQVEIRKLFGF